MLSSCPLAPWLPLPTADLALPALQPTRSHQPLLYPLCVPVVWVVAVLRVSVFDLMMDAGGATRRRIYSPTLNEEDGTVDLIIDAAIH